MAWRSLSCGVSCLPTHKSPRRNCRQAFLVVATVIPLRYPSPMIDTKYLSKAGLKEVADKALAELEIKKARKRDAMRRYRAKLAALNAEKE